MKQDNTFMIVTLMFAVIFTFFGIGDSFSQVTDYDGNTYKTVVIGNQEWMAENLNVSSYRNGDIIPEVKDAKEWEKLTTGAWCYYGNSTENGKKYGKLYNWYAVNDPRGLAPEGWHVPSDAEWTQMTEYLGGKEEKKTTQGIDYWEIADVGGKLKAITLWKSPNTGATNSRGFTAFPGGYRYFKGVFGFIGKFGYFWSSSEFNNLFAWLRFLGFDYSCVYRDFGNKIVGFSIRCVRD